MMDFFRDLVGRVKDLSPAGNIVLAFALGFLFGSLLF
jgi:hypothetical protein